MSLLLKIEVPESKETEPSRLSEVSNKSTAIVPKDTLLLDMMKALVSYAVALEMP